MVDYTGHAWRLLEAQHYYLKLPGRFTVAGIARHTGITPDRVRRLFKGTPGAPADHGELPSEATIEQVATAYRIGARVLRSAFIDDAGRNANLTNASMMEATAYELLQRARDLRENSD